MKLHDYPETDSLYIDLAQATRVESKRVASGVVLDFDAAGRLVGIDIDHASRRVDLSRLEADRVPFAGAGRPGTQTGAPPEAKTPVDRPEATRHAAPGPDGRYWT